VFSAIQYHFIFVVELVEVVEPVFHFSKCVISWFTWPGDIQNHVAKIGSAAEIRAVNSMRQSNRMVFG
jgi:hypothetical protein